MSKEDDFIQKIRRGDESAIKKLYQYYFYCTKPIRDTGNHDLAAEIFQAAVVAFYEKTIRDLKFSLECPVKTFLCAIVKNIWSAQRRNKNNQHTKITEVELGLSDADQRRAALEEQTWNDGQYSNVINLIQRSSPRCVEILTMFYVEGLTLAEIATVLNLKKEYVKTKKSECLAKIKDQL